MRKKLWISLVVLFCLTGLAACGLSGSEPAGTEQKDPVAEQAYPEQGEPGDQLTVTEPVTSEPADPDTLELRERFLASLRGEEYKQEKNRSLDAEVEMGNPVYAMARFSAESLYARSFGLFVSLWHANPSWWVEEGPEAPPVWDQYQEMILDLAIELQGDTYQYRYHYHDDIWEAVRWPERKIPFRLEYEAAGWDSTPKEYGEFIEGEEIFNADDFYAIYRELDLENDGRLANEWGVIERLGSPECFFLRYDEGVDSDLSLHMGYPFGEVLFQDTTLIRLTNDSVSGPRDTRVGDHYEDVIAKFPREENREDSYFYEVEVYVTDGPMSPRYRTSAEGFYLYEYFDDEKKITDIIYRNGRGHVMYEIENDIVASISTHMLVDGW